MTAKKDLAELIKANPDATFIIDNDCWWMMAADGETELARDGEVIELGDGGYGCGPCYGGDILQALAVVVGVKVESV